MNGALPPLTIHSPETVQEAVGLLHELGDSARVYSGGTELLLVMKAGFLSSDHLVDIKEIPDLKEIGREDGTLVIGATTTYREMERSPELCRWLPAMIEVIGHVGNVRIRAAGTMSGNLCFAEPHSDIATFLLAFDTEVECVGEQGNRRMPLADFIVGPFESALEPAELLTRVRVRLPDGRTGIAYQRFAALERPTAGAVVRLDADADDRIRAARIAVGAVGPVPARMPEAEARATGATVPELLERATEVAAAVEEQADVMEDLYGAEDYKRALAGELTRRALQQAADRLQSGRGQHA